MENNQKGITLLEVLMTITILLIVGGLMYGVFFQSVTSFERTQNNALLRQEANLILAEFTNIHRKQETYTVSYDQSNHALLINDRVISNELFQYNVAINGQSIAETSSGITVNSSNFLDIELTVIDRNNPDHSFTISTIINKISKEGVIEDEQK